MKFTCPAGALAETLNFAARVLDAKSIKKFPILGTVLIRAADGVATFTGTDLDRLAIVELDVEVAEPGVIAVGLERLLKVAENFRKDATVTISSDGTAATVSCGRSRYRLPLLSPGDFPPIFAPGNGASGDTSSAEQPTPVVQEIPLPNVDGVRAAKFAIGEEDTRYYLNGAYLHSVDGKLLCVATDGTMLARTALPDSAGYVAAGRGIVIPGKTIHELLRMAGKGPITLRFDSRIVEIRAERKILRNKLIDAEYVDYARVIPKPSDNFVEIDRLDLISALERLGAVAATKTEPRVGLTWNNDGGLELCIPDQGDAAADELDVITSGGSLQMAVSIARFIKLLSEIESDRIKLDANPCSPLRVTRSGDSNNHFLAYADVVGTPSHPTTNSPN
jgi:DNA polymerase-3 subunit beta